MRPAALACLLGAAGCVQSLPSPGAGQVSSLEITMRDPDVTALGSPGAPVELAAATFDIAARDEHGQPVVRDLDLLLYVSSGGIKAGGLTGCGGDDTAPVERIHVPGGRLDGHTAALPRIFGPTALWLDDPASRATGASPVIYIHNPRIADLQTPPDLSAGNATFCTPFDGRFVSVDAATGSGKLVVTSVFGNAFVVTDSGAAGFQSLYLFVFGAPPRYIVPGKTLHSFSGNIGKFNGFTELNFPIFDATDDPPDVALLPAPLPIDVSLLRDLPTLLASAASVVEITGTVCDPNADSRSADSFRKFNTVVIDAGDGTCSSIDNFSMELPGKTVGTFDPLQHIGASLRVRGMLQNSSGQSTIVDDKGLPIACSDSVPCDAGNCVGGVCKKNPFNFWTVLVRTADDLQLQ